MERINIIDVNKVREIFNYHSDGYLIWTIDKPGLKRGDRAGWKMDGRHEQIGIDGELYLTHRLIFAYHNGYSPEGIIDHIDKNCNNNKIENLRHVSRMCNQRNMNNRIDNKSGVKGVWWEEKRGKWLVSIRVKNKSYFIGYFNKYDFDEAVCTRLAVEQCLNWNGCDDNSPAYRYYNEHIKKG